jgi:RNA polymerase sigma-70 factor, ECF subfamily
MQPREPKGFREEPFGQLGSVTGIKMNKAAIRTAELMPSAGRLEELYATSQRRLVIQVASLTGDVSAAEDLVQEAFGRCVEKWAQISTYEDPEGWVRTVAFNLARSRWRRLKRGATALAKLHRSAVESRSVAEDNGLLAAVSKLPDDEREVIVRHHLLDLPVAAVAVQMGLPEGPVKSRLARGRAHLAQMLESVDKKEGRNE